MRGPLAQALEGELAAGRLGAGRAPATAAWPMSRRSGRDSVTGPAVSAGDARPVGVQGGVHGFGGHAQVLAEKLHQEIAGEQGHPQFPSGRPPSGATPARRANPLR